MRNFKAVGLVLLIAAGCQSTAKKNDATGPKHRPSISTSGPLWGHIGGKPSVQWTMTRAWAYTKNNRIVVGFFGDNAPTGCSVKNGSVNHTYEENDQTFSHLTLWLPPGSNKTPFTSDAVEVSFTTIDQKGQELTAPAENQTVTIDSMTDTEITGSLSAKNYSSDVSGTFTAKFCQND